MSSGGDRIAERALALVGTRFRPQGRDPAHGLDCVGAAAAAAGVPAERVPTGYDLKGQKLAEVEHGLCDLGCRPVAGDALHSGDILVCAPAPAQFHVVVVVRGGFVHADAMLRRVVERPFPVPWPVIGAWRLESDDGEEE